MLKKIYEGFALHAMIRQGFPHEWAETYARRLGEEIEAATSEAELRDIRKRVSALAKSPPPIGWIGA